MSRSVSGWGAHTLGRRNLGAKHELGEGLFAALQEKGRGFRPVIAAGTVRSQPDHIGLISGVWKLWFCSESSRSH